MLLDGAYLQKNMVTNFTQHNRYGEGIVEIKIRLDVGKILDALYNDQPLPTTITTHRGLDSTFHHHSFLLNFYRMKIWPLQEKFFKMYDNKFAQI